jgi:DHA1 family tetracycline resistance protein-like MFS transporter
MPGGLGGKDYEAAPYVGGLMTTYYTMAFLFSPLLGVLSDRFGRRPVILLSLVGSGLDYFAMALSPTLGWLFVTRAINGLSGASFTVAGAYVADVTPPEKRAAGFGMLGAAFGVGFVVGPILGGLLGQVSLRLPFYVAGGLTLVNALYGALILPESLAKDRRAPLRLGRANPLGAFAGLAKYPIVVGLGVSFFLFNLAQFILHATWALYTEHRYKWEPRDIGMSLFAVGIAAAVVQGGVVRRLVPRLGEGRSLLVGGLIAAGAYAGYGWSPAGWMLYVFIVAGSLAGIAQPAAQAIITKTVRPDEQGAVQGALTSLASLAGVFGPSLGAAVFGHAIAPEARASVPGASFYVSAAVSLLATAVAAWALGLGPARAQAGAAG